MAPRISAVLNTLNEESRLPFALQSVRPWVDQIVVMDMHSDDRTAAIAREFGAEVHLHERTGYVEPARAAAIGKCSGDWILILDADELVPAPLARRLRRIAEEDRADAVVVSRLNYFFGRPLLHGGWGPGQDRHLRFFRRGSLALPERIHGALAAAPGARVLELAYEPGEAIVHFNYLDVAQFVERLNRYTTIEAAASADPAARPGAPAALLACAREFEFRYLRRAGFRDGWRGLYLALAMAFYRLTAFAKRREAAEGGDRAAIERCYRELAEALVAEHEARATERAAGPADDDTPAAR